MKLLHSLSINKMVKCFYCNDEGNFFKYGYESEYECVECNRILRKISNIVAHKEVPESTEIRVTYHVIEIDHYGKCGSEGTYIYTVQEMMIDLPFPERVRHLVSLTPYDEGDDNNDEEPFEDVRRENLKGSVVKNIDVEHRRMGLALNSKFRDFYQVKDYGYHLACYGSVKYIPVNAVLL